MKHRDDSLSLCPLRDCGDSLDPELRRGAQWIAELGPLERSERRRRLVWARLHAPPARPTFGLRNARLLSVVALLCASAAAAYWSPSPPPTEALESFSSPSALPVAPQPAPVGADLLVEPVASPAPKPAKSVAERASAAPGPPRKPRATSRPREAASARSTATAQKARPQRTAPEKPLSTATPTALETQLLSRAMQARQNGNLREMNALVEEYRRKHPEGVLQEEALALAIEAAVRGQDARARSLARRYLDRFPNGRFRAQAQAALEFDAE